MRQIADAVGVSYDRLASMATGRTRLPHGVLEAARAFIAQSQGELGKVKAVGELPMAHVRVVGDVAAGPAELNVDPDRDTILVPAHLARHDCVAYIVTGESMMPALEPGDVAIFREHHTPRRGYAFLLRSDHGYRIKILNWDREWQLVSLNPAFPVEPATDHQLIGYLVGWYRARGPRETLDFDPNGLRL